MIRVRLIIFIALSLCVSCVQKQQFDGDILKIDPLQYSNINNDNVEQVLDDVKIIQLATSDSSYVSIIKKILITPKNDFIILDRTGLIQFSQSGEFVRRISQQGRAKNEYVSIEGICIDNNSVLYILDAMNKVLCYDTESGGFIRSIQLDWGTTSPHRSDEIIPCQNGGFYIISCNTSTERNENPQNTIYEFTSDGKLKEKLLPISDFMITMNLTSQGYDNSYFVRPFDNSNIVYKTSDNRLEQYCLINFGDRNIPDGKIYDNFGVLDYEGYFESNYYKFISRYVETKDYMTFLCAGPKSKAISYVINKHNGKGFALIAPDEITQPFNVEVADSDYMYFVMNKYSKEALDEMADPLTKYVVNKYGVLDTDENPRIVGIKFNI